MNNMDKTNEMMKEIIKFRQEIMNALMNYDRVSAWTAISQHENRCNKIFPSEVWPLYEEVIQ
jgi:hypothetical protein